MTLALRFPERLPLGFDLVRVHAYLEITEVEYNAIREQAGFKKADAHAVLGESVTVAGTALALSGLLGVHDYRQQKDADEVSKTGIVAHYSLELEADVAVEKEEDKEWASLSDALAKVLGNHACSVRMQQLLPIEKVVPATSLPIQLGESGVSGFTEIRGVRLVQPDPSNPKQVLFSVILELFGDSYSLGTMTTIESRLDGELLTRAINRLAEISGLAYKEVTAQ